MMSNLEFRLSDMEFMQARQFYLSLQLDDNKKRLRTKVSEATKHQVFDEALSAQFSIPDDYGVVVAIPIGFPLGRLGPVTRKPATTQTFFNRWGEQQ